MSSRLRVKIGTSLARRGAPGPGSRPACGRPAAGSPVLPIAASGSGALAASIGWTPTPTWSPTRLQSRAALRRSRTAAAAVVEDSSMAARRTAATGTPKATARPSWTCRLHRALPQLTEHQPATGTPARRAVARASSACDRARARAAAEPGSGSVRPSPRTPRPPRPTVEVDSAGRAAAPTAATSSRRRYAAGAGCRTGRRRRSPRRQRPRRAARRRSGPAWRCATGSRPARAWSRPAC